MMYLMPGICSSEAVGPPRRGLNSAWEIGVGLKHSFSLTLRMVLFMFK